MSILERFPTLRQALDSNKHIIFIINVDEIELPNNSLGAINHPNITVVIASRRSIANIQEQFPQHENFIAQTGLFVETDDATFTYSKPDYSDIKRDLDTFADGIGIKKSIADDYFLCLSIPQTHVRYADAVDLAHHLIADSKLTVTETPQGFTIGPSNPDGMWTGVQLALFMILAEECDDFNNPLIVYVGKANQENVVAMRHVKERGGLAIGFIEDAGREPNYANATLANPQAFIPFYHEIHCRLFAERLPSV